MTEKKKVTVGPLNTVASVRRELGRVYKAARLGELETRDATRFTYILREIRESLVAVVFEERIEALEAAKGDGSKS